MLRMLPKGKGIGLVALILTLSLFLFAGVACGSKASPPVDTQAAAEQPQEPATEPQISVAPAEEGVADSASGDVVIRFTVPGFGSDASPFNAAKMQMWEEALGVKIVFQTMEWATFLNKLSSNELQMFSLGWVADWPLPDNFLEVLFHSQSEQNHYSYGNPEVDALLDQARLESNLDKRLALYQEAERLIVRDAPVIPTTFGADYYLVKPWLEGFELSASIVPFLKDVIITDPERGDVVHLPLGTPYGGGGSVPTLDPHKSQDVNSSQYLQEIYGGLVGFDPKTLEIIPDIAESWDISDDGLTYTFRLRRNVDFHDGRKVTAHDFKWSFERVADPDTLSLTADTYLGDIVGFKERLDTEHTGVAEVSGVVALDDYTLQITIKEPIASFLHKLTYPTGFVLDRETVGVMSPRNAFQVRPNGTGPFRLVEYTPDQKLVLERNDNYYRERRGNVRKFVFEAGGSLMTRYENNEVWMTPVGIVDWERVTDPGNPLNSEFHEALQLSFGYVGFNVTIPPFDDPTVRQAFAMAINNELIARAVTKGMVPVATGILPPGMPGYNATPKTWPYDPEAARALIQESRYYPRLKKAD